MADLLNELQATAQQTAQRVGIMRKPRSSVLPFVVFGLAAAALGALLAYALDPQLGRTRRAETKDRVAGSARRIGRWSERRGRWLSSTAAGLSERIQHSGQVTSEPWDEVDLANRVKSELFRDPGIDKGGISINVERDEVFLRGTAPSREQIEDIGHRVSRIDGVGSVVNLLHVAGEPVPAQEAEATLAGSGSTTA